MSSGTASGPSTPRFGLSRLSALALEPRSSALLELACAPSQGPPAWRARKRAEARDVLALAQLAPRLKVLALDLRTSFKALLALETPVPCAPDERGILRVERQALLGLEVEQRAAYAPSPGFAFVQVLEPRGVWHPNVSADPAQRLCLGPVIQAGTPVRELVLASYGALSMQLLQMDELDPAGVLNVEAARWWQQNVERAPLGREPFLAGLAGGPAVEGPGA